MQALLNRWDRLNDEQKKLMLDHRLGRLRPAQPADRRAPRRGPHRHRPAPAAPAAQRRRRCSTRRIVDSVAAGTARPIDLEVADDLPDIHADPDKFTQVVTNLVENAVRHGEGTVRVTLCRYGPGEPATRPGVRIIVDDEGEGIPAEMRRRVFTKFWKGGARGGSGLGLYIVGGLTKAHGGTVTHRRRARRRRPDPVVAWPLRRCRPPGR